MSKVRGVDILVMIDLDQLLATPTGIANWVAAGGQQNSTLSEESEAMDTTTKDGGAGAYEYEYGLYGWTVSCDGIYVTDNEAYNALKTAMRTRKKVKLRIREAGQDVEEGTALVVSRELEAPYDDMTTYAMEFQGEGFLTTPTA